MTLFLFLAAAFAAFGVALVAWPLYRPRPDANGKPVSASRGLAAVAIVALPLAAFVLYFALSDWPWDGGAGAAGDHGQGTNASLMQVASQLQERLQRDKGDAEGWKLLGRTYVVMGDFPKALDAYKQAYILTSGADIEAMLGYAEASVLVDESGFSGEAGQLFEQALGAQPDNPKALWYGGLTAYRKQQLDTARERWTTLRGMGGPPEIQQVLDERIAEINQAIGPPAGDSATAAAGPVVGVAAGAAPAQAAEGAIPLDIAVAPALAARVPPDTTLFVLARSGTGGPPLAALRRSTSELPLQVTLTDANAMIPGTSLTQVDALVLVARVSLTGRPIASSGDLYGEVRYDPATKGRIKLTIDRVVE